MRTPCLIVFLFTVASFAQAHEKGVTDTHIKMGFASLSILLTLPNKTVPSINGGSESISKGFQVSNDGKSCSLSAYKQSTLEKIDSGQYWYQFDCQDSLGEVGITYQLFEQDPTHKNYTRVSIAGRHQSFVFSSLNSSRLIPVAKVLKQWSRSLADSRSDNTTFHLDAIWNVRHYFGIGFFHILEGYDHILFLLGLLLLPLGLKQILIISSTFTIAHSITLAISIIQDVTIAPWLIESAIALSIIYVGIENLRYWQTRKGRSVRSIELGLSRLSMVFVFGLIHGFGFSYLLKEIGFEEQLTGALLFFNLGVEGGQLVIVSLAAPLIAFAFHKRFGRGLSKLGSIAISGLGGLWLMERLI